MIIVANSYMLNIFRKIPLFKMNLGINLIDIKLEKVHITDPFMMKYLNMTNGKQILTYGTIGKLTFYQEALYCSLIQRHTGRSRILR